MAVQPLHDRPRDLELDEDTSFQHREQRWQRAGTLALIVFLVAALAGLFGSGPLSHATAELPGLLRVDYQRTARYETPESLTVRVMPSATTQREVRVWLDRRYLEHSRVESVVPPPHRVEAAGHGSVYVFPVAQSGHPLVLTFQMQPERIGLLRGAVGLEGMAAPATSVAFRQLVWP